MTKLKRIIMLCLVLQFAFNATILGQSSSVINLFSDLDVERNQVSDIVDTRIRNLFAKNLVDTSLLVKLNVDFRDADFIRLQAFDGEALTLEKTQLRSRGVKSFTWFSNVDLAQPNILVVNDENVTASIYHKGKLHRIHPLGEGLHLFYRVNSSLFGEKGCTVHDPSTVLKDTLNPIDQHRKISRNPRMNAVLDVMVPYTTTVKNASSDVSGLIQLAVEETNISYQFSGTPVLITLNLVHSVEVGYVEPGTGHADILNELANPNDGKIDNLPDLRETYNADIVAFIVEEDGLCGIASAILTGPNGAYCTVNWTCATGNFSFAHEIGHLQGARHDDDTNNIPFAYGHGYKIDTDESSFRTIMATQDPNVDRIALWSSSETAGLLGDLITGDAAQRDNARVLNETIGHISNFRGLNLTLDDNTVWRLQTDFLSIPSKPWLYVGDNSIVAKDAFDVSGIIEDVEFQVTNVATGSITLKPGFTVKNGGKFRAFISNTVSN